MKKLVFTLFICICALNLYCQNCIPIAYVFTRQSQIDSFPLNFTGCTVIDGNIGVSNLIDINDPVTNFDSLKYVDTIKGSIQILASTFNDISGLSGLKSINGSFIVKGTALASFEGLDSLQEIKGILKVESNNQLINLVGFNNLSKIGGLEIKYQNQLLDVNEFSNLIKISGDLKIDGTSIENLDGFENVDSIYGDLYISANSNLDTLNSFDSLTYIGKNLIIRLFNGTAYIEDFSRLTLIKNSLIIEGNIEFNSSFNALRKVDYIRISSNPVINEVSTFNEVDSIFGSIVFEYNNQLISISGFQNLNFLPYLSLNSNTFLSSINGFNHSFRLLSVQFYNNPFLSQCSIIPICLNFELGSTGFGTFNQNGVGCNSENEVNQSCPPFPDQDMDGISDYLDNCPNFVSSNISDNDSDGIGDECDNCIFISNSTQVDIDLDGVGDQCDNCIDTYNPNQMDCNGNGIGDICESGDIDCDGIFDVNDNCVDTYNPNQIDLNQNGIGDACEEFPKIGIGTILPKSELHLSNGTLFIDNPEKGIVLKNFQGQCYTFRANGHFMQIIYVPCPQ